MFDCSDNKVMPPVLTDKRILLASNSPRRRELLGMILPEYSVPESVDIEECYPPDLAADDVPSYLSRLKAQPYLSGLEDCDILITADTVVIVDGHILGKPKDHADACRMLGMLSGRTHTVVTGVTISDRNDSYTFSESTEVTFENLEDFEIEEYVLRYRPYDKAGAYGIQEYIGAIGIKEIKGSFYNVMGLPVGALYRHLRRFIKARDFS